MPLYRQLQLHISSNARIRCDYESFVCLSRGTATLGWLICVNNGSHVIVSQLRSVCVISCTGNGLTVTSLECVQTVLDNSCVSENVIKL